MRPDGVGFCDPTEPAQSSEIRPWIRSRETAMEEAAYESHTG